MRKPTFYICENKDADQRGDHEADHTLFSNISEENKFYIKLISIQFSEVLCRRNTDAMPCF